MCVCVEDIRNHLGRKSRSQHAAFVSECQKDSERLAVSPRAPLRPAEAWSGLVRGSFGVMDTENKGTFVVGFVFFFL